MNRALIWKEWRQQRPLVLTAVAAALLLPLFALMGSWGGFRFDSLTQVLLALHVMVIVPVFAAATASLSFADDRADQTMGFLLSRPASRARVWWVKVGVALMAFVAIAVLTAGVAMLLSTMIGGPTISELMPRSYPSGFRPIGGGGTRTFVINAVSEAFGDGLGASFAAFTLSGPGFLMVLFGASVFWSTRSRRPLSAMFAGILTALLLMLVQMPLTFIGNGFRVYPLWPLMAAAALLIASFLIFQKADPDTA